VIIRGSGSGYVVVKWTTAIVTALFLLDAAKGAHHRDTGMVATWLVGAALFAVMFIKTVTVRVVLSGDEILYGGLFRRTRALRLDQVGAARGVARPAHRGMAHYLVIEPLDRQTPPMRIRTDLFSHVDVQKMRGFLGDKLRRR